MTIKIWCENCAGSGSQPDYIEAWQCKECGEKGYRSVTLDELIRLPEIIQGGIKHLQFVNTVSTVENWKRFFQLHYDNIKSCLNLDLLK